MKSISFASLLSAMLLLALVWVGCDPSKSNNPDLFISDVSLDGNNRLSITIKNEGYGVVTKDTGLLQIAIDGKIIGGYALAGLSDKGYKALNGTTTIPTNFRLSGTNRRVAVQIDPENVIGESNEFQNTVSRSITPPVINGPDFHISDLSLNAANQLRITVRNIGNQASSANFPVKIRVIVNETVVADLTPNLPAIAPGASTTVSPAPAIAVNSLKSVRTLLTTNGFADEQDNTNNVREEWLGGAINLAPYHTLLAINKIATNVIWENATGVRNYTQWTNAEKAALDNAIRSLENGQNPTLSQPPALLPGNDISPADAWTIFLAHIAQSLWVDVNNKVNWNLSDYSSDNLNLLLDGRKLIRYLPSNNLYGFEVGNMGNVTPWNAKVAFDFMDNFGLIQSSGQATLYKLTDWMRGHLIHISGGADLVAQFGYAGPPPVDKVLYPLEGKRHITAGCWGTTGLYNAVLRTVNIPVQSGTMGLGGGTHSRPIFPSLNKSMPHGDDPYTATLIPSGVPVPTANIFYSLADMNSKFSNPTPDCVGGNCNTVGDQASYNQGKDHLKLAFDLKGDWVLYTYATHDAAYMDEYFQGPFIGGGVHLYAKPYFEPAVRASMIAEVEARLTSLGDGDIEAGKQIVTERVNRWLANK